MLPFLAVPLFPHLSFWVYVRLRKLLCRKKRQTQHMVFPSQYMLWTDLHQQCPISTNRSQKTNIPLSIVSTLSRSTCTQISSLCSGPRPRGQHENMLSEITREHAEEFLSDRKWSVRGASSSKCGLIVGGIDPACVNRIPSPTAWRETLRGENLPVISNITMSTTIKKCRSRKNRHESSALSTLYGFFQ
jgi:hypothetical protein